MDYPDDAKHKPRREVPAGFVVNPRGTRLSATP